MAPRVRVRKLSLTTQQIRAAAERMTKAKEIIPKAPIDVQTYLKKAMSKEFTFSLGDRVAMTNLFNDFKGSITQLAQISEDVKHVVITKEEWDKAEVKTIPAGKDKDGNDLIRQEWKEEGNEKKITLDGATVDYLRAQIKKKSDAGELGFADLNLVALDKKLSA